ncbi:MAG: hypothetical protein IPJ65_41640 [Archangiaceae bacterium]|nr:hypothetical protein [Archangiaceae bacterium]
MSGETYALSLPATNALVCCPLGSGASLTRLAADGSSTSATEGQVVIPALDPEAGRVCGAIDASLAGGQKLTGSFRAALPVVNR